MNTKQSKDKMLRSYITCFNKKAFSIDDADDKILVAAFMNGLRKGKFLFSLYKNDLKTMSNIESSKTCINTLERLDPQITT